MNSIQLFIEEAKQLHLNFFDFSLLEDEACNPYIEGRLHLPDEEGKFIDSYNIKIEVRDGYPNNLPLVYETAQRIPINIDWHVFPDGHCCIVTPPEEFLICKKGVTLEKFITNNVLPYFHNQLFRELKGYFLNERSHGNEGIREFFFSKFKSSDSEKISKWLLFIAKKKQPTRTSACFCGSGKKYRKCHRTIFKELSLLTPSQLISYSALMYTQ
ncbi:SEC-C metal-binding domain-containing protein [uncultured Chryseobacterium sp.]|uniref:SEC-C metal-binding domain-containing protein n=1 Tax=uncultured Chryseobacterium sp. TaxID=259322 RepID=UPI0025DFC9B7|nr:SEC-C metal-binding domain-containing protein [uncultured Chryseobacterium sp.]